ncbi:MAG: antibiotic biosynthesis monooxygenase [Acetobacteraceae bacterium]|nr:antibiotic biosynthesis monooxygenase [Acetobacteraceae bacterium]
MTETTLLTEWTARPGAEAALRALLLELGRWTRAERGCLGFALLAAEARFVTLVRYETASAAANHAATPHFAALVQVAAIPLLADRRVGLFAEAGHAAGCAA